MKKYLMCGLFSHLINLKPKKKKCHFHHFYCSKTTEEIKTHKPGLKKLPKRSPKLVQPSMLCIGRGFWSFFTPQSNLKKVTPKLPQKFPKKSFFSKYFWERSSINWRKVLWNPQIKAQKSYPKVTPKVTPKVHCYAHKKIIRCLIFFFFHKFHINFK